MFIARKSKGMIQTLLSLHPSIQYTKTMAILLQLQSKSKRVEKKISYSSSWSFFPQVGHVHRIKRTEFIGHQEKKRSPIPSRVTFKRVKLQSRDYSQIKALSKPFPTVIMFETFEWEKTDWRLSKCHYLFIIYHSSLTPGRVKYSICMANAKIKKVNTSDFS